MEDKSSITMPNINSSTITEPQGPDQKWSLSSGTHINPHWWWALASATQLGLGIRAIKKGYAGECKLMPVKAFGVASLFVGAAATATVGALRASGIYKVDDMKRVGANIRTGMGVPPRKQAE